MATRIIGRERTRCLCLTLVPYTAAAGEGETKRLSALRVENGTIITVFGDILICRFDRAVPASRRAKSKIVLSVAQEKAVISVMSIPFIKLGPVEISGA